MARKKVLIVDDDAKVVEVLKLYLVHDGCEVFTAYTGTEGLRLARENRARPDCPGHHAAGTRWSSGLPHTEK